MKKAARAQKLNRMRRKRGEARAKERDEWLKESEREASRTVGVGARFATPRCGAEGGWGGDGSCPEPGDTALPRSLAEYARHADVDEAADEVAAAVTVGLRAASAAKRRRLEDAAAMEVGGGPTPRHPTPHRLIPSHPTTSAGSCPWTPAARRRPCVLTTHPGSAPSRGSLRCAKTRWWRVQARSGARA